MNKNIYNLKTIERKDNDLINKDVLDREAYKNICDITYIREVSKSMRSRLGIDMQVCLNDNNKVVVLEKNLESGLITAIKFENYKQFNEYFDYIVNLTIFSKVNDMDIKIQRGIISNEYESVIKDKPQKIFFDSGKFEINCNSSRYDKSVLSDNDSIVNNILNNISKNDNNFFLEFDKYELSPYEVNKITKFIYKDLNLSKEEESALEYYKTDGYKFINPFLNCSKQQLSKKKETFFEQIDEAFIEKIKLIFNVISKFKTNENMVLYRGGTAKGKRLEVGNPISYNSFISTSASREVGESFGDIIYKMRISKEYSSIPMDLLRSSKNSHEAEFLLQPTTFIIEGIHDNEFGQKIVTLVPTTKEFDIDKAIDNSLAFWGIKNLNIREENRVSENRPDLIANALNVFSGNSPKKLEIIKDKENKSLFEFI